MDLTGGSLVSYMLRVIRDIVNRSPRFKQTLGEVTFSANTIISWRDVWVSMTNVSTSGNRLSPNYFMCTQLGRAILAKVGDKDGQFIEWTREVDPTRTTPTAGVYYLNVDFFNDQTRELGITVHKYRWLEGILKNATGTVVYFRPGIDLTQITLSDAATSLPVQANLYTDVVNGSFAYLITPTQILVATYGVTAPIWDNTVTYAAGAVVAFGGSTYIADSASTNLAPDLNPTFWSAYTTVVPNAGQRLEPLTDYWYQRPESAVIIPITVTGQQLAKIPSPYVSVSFSDQDGYTLRPGLDYAFQGPQWIMTSAYTPPGSTITATMMVKVNPYNNVGIMPENYLQVALQPGESLAPEQVFIHTTSGDYTVLTTQPDGSLLLPQLLQPGDCLRWEVRVDSGQMKALAKKWEVTNLPQVDPTTIQYGKPDNDGNLQPLPFSYISSADPSQLVGIVQTSAGQPLLVNGQAQPILAGLRLAIGDNVVVNDQAAIIVSPSMTETYEVFGSKENLTFTLEVKANDLQTASDLSEMLKRELLIMRRENTEADGLTIFEITRSYTGAARDLSNTAPSYVYTLSVTASADWKVYIPLVTRLTSLEITEIGGQSDFLGKLQLQPRMHALGSEIFIPTYR